MEIAHWPARNVAEYAYCPRLFYFMEVEGIHVKNADTEQGQMVHRSVDKVSHTKSPPDESESEPKKIRSLTLTDDELRLTATLDLAEVSGNAATPIEFRKGRPKRIYSEALTGPRTRKQSDAPANVEPWPTDRAQLGLQAILLERAGYTVNQAMLYYAAEKRKLTIPVDDELKAEALEVLKSAQQCAEGPRPLPLINDPKCPRCSLQPICLPDEVNAQREGCPSVNRKLWPPRDDGIHVIAQRRGTRVGVRGSAMQITEADGSPPRSIPLAGVESVSLFGSVQMSTQAMHTLAAKKIPVAFLSGAGRLVTMLDPLDSVSADTRRNQVRAFDQPERCLKLAQALIAAKIHNQRTILMRNGIDVPQTTLDGMAQQIENAVAAKSLESLRGHEGQAAALYFGAFGRAFKTNVGESFNEHGRERRPPPDPVNCVLSFAYSMLTHECTAALRTARLEPSIGAFHVSRPGRPALALDLMEPFRPLIADSIAVSGFNRSEIRDGHFNHTAAGCMMTDHGRKAFFGAYGRRMDQEVTHPTFGYRMSYRRMLILHARMIAAWVNNEIPDLSFLTTR